VTGVLGGLAAGRDAEADLAEAAPELVAGYRAALPRAAQTVGRRLLGALCREDIGDSRQRYAADGQRHAFDRVEFAHSPMGHPAQLLDGPLAGAAGTGLAAELDDAVINLAIAYARTGPTGRGNGGGDADEAALALERRAVDGHNLHPCARTRLGWRPTDVLRHDLEARQTHVGFVAVRADLHTGDDIGAALAAGYPGLPVAPDGYALVPVHAWQLSEVLPHRYADLVRDGALRPLDGSLPAAPTAALRTLLLPPGADGRRRYLKLSLDIQVTSTRRTISVASTRNGPAISGLLHRLLDDDPAGQRVLLLPEVAGAAVPAGTGRDVSVIVRDGLAGRLRPGEVAVPGGALSAPGVLAGLVDRYAVSRGRADRAGAALAFVTDYAGLLLTPVLRLAGRFGIGLEAHLQNCLPTFVGGVPHRLVLRDFAGLRIHLPRLAAAGHRLELWPGSVVGTDDPAVMRAKVCYAALQAHLGEVVVQLVRSHGLDERSAWRAVREVLDEVYAPLLEAADRAIVSQAAGDHAALTARYVPHKALVRMRLAGTGDVYLPVHNPLYGA